MDKKISTLILYAFLAGLSGGLLSSALMSVPTAAADNNRALVAGEFRLTDETGRTRMLLTLAHGKPRLFMLDDSGEYRLEMGLGKSGEPHIWLRDIDGASKIQIALTAKGRPGFRLADHRGQDRALIGLSENGDPTILLLNHTGHDRLALWSDKKESGIALAMKNGRPIAAFSAPEGNKARLSFFGSAGELYKTID